ncbi:MAG: DUF6701 domain-containing protein [Methylococcaceae bacterium]
MTIIATGRFLRIIGIVLGFVVLIVTQQLQAATYTYRNDVFSYDTPSGSATSVVWHAGTDATWLGSPACTTYPNGDDDWADIAFPSGFSFTFNNVLYSQVRVYSNGMLAFGADSSGFHRDYTPQALPITAAAGNSFTAPCTNAIPSKLMIAYWVDIIAGTATGITGAAVKYELLTTAGQRRFVISWDNVALYGSSATRYSFQIVLYESSGGLNSNFKYQYTKPLSGSGVTGNPGTVGVQVSTADYTQYSYNQAFIDPVAGTTILWYPSNQLFAKKAEYRFDESAWTGTADEIKDTSGASNNASRVGAATNIAAGKLCRGGSFTNNTLNTTVDAVSTPIVPASIGSVDFWYKSTNAWNSANTMLFDATTVASKPFFLMKRSNGKLRFVITDSAGTVSTAETSTAYTYAANTWHHIGVSWNLQPGTNQTVQQIFLDGVLVNTTTTTPFRSTTTGSIATLSNVYIGDNRTSGVTPSNGSPNGANGTIDEVYVYAIDINASQAAADMALTRPVCTALDHFHIVHGGSQLSCNGSVASITVEAHDPSHALISLSGATMNMATSTSHGTWSGISTINPVINATPGNGSYTFSNESSIVLGLANSNVEILNIDLASGAVTEHSGAAASCVANDYTFNNICDADFEFIQAGFRFLDSAGNNIGNQIAGTSSGTYYLQAVKNTCTSGTCTGVCTSVFPAGLAVNIGLAFECRNPTSCAGQQVILAASGTANAGLGAMTANNNGAVSSTTGSYSTQSVTFNAPSPTPSVPFTLKYADVGQIALWARYPNSSSATVSGSSTAFIVKPHHFSVSAIKQTAAPQLPNPAAASASDAKFVKAGEAFSATVTAMTSTNVATPNFGKETSPEGVLLTRNLLLPSGGAAGVLSNATLSGASFSSGVATVSNLAWNEVGIISLTPSIADADYLGVGDITGTTSSNIGRFIPDHFALSTLGTATPACGTFTYFAQDGFSNTAFGLTAQNLAGNTTANYNSSFAKLGLTTWTNFGFSTSTALPAGATLSASASAPTGTWTNGVASISAKHQISRPTNPTAETTVVIKAAPVDTDGVTMTATAIAPSTPLRYGRVFLQNVYGSELLSLNMPLEAQYYNGSDYITNTSDNCTVIPASSIMMSNYTTNLNACETQLSPTGNLNLVAGKITNLNLSPPNSSNTGSVDLTINLGTVATNKTCLSAIETNATAANLTWLGSNPNARATFGLYKGNDKQIYFRELY